MHKIHTKFYHTCSLLVQNATHSITLYTHQHEYCIISSKASCFWPSFQWHFVDGSTIQFTCAIPRFSKVDNHRNQVTPQTFCINRLSNTEKSQRVKMPTTTTTPNLHFQTNNCNYRYKQPIFILLHLDWCLFTITIVIHILFWPLVDSVSNQSQSINMMVMVMVVTNCYSSEQNHHIDSVILIGEALATVNLHHNHVIEKKQDGVIVHDKWYE